MADDGILFGVERIQIKENSYYRRKIRRLAREASPAVVALKVSREGAPSAFLWIDGEILPGEELGKRFAKPPKLGTMPDTAVLSRAETPFPATPEDSIISLRPRPKK